MLRLDLARLEREGRLQVDVEIPAEDSFWADTGLAFEGPVGVHLVATEAGTGEVVVRGSVTGRLALECRRCLVAVATAVEQEVTLVYAEREDGAPEDEVGDLRPLQPGAMHVELGDAVREELMLSLERYAVCDPTCLGLCPSCGINLNQESCHCAREEPDPRWETLRALRTD